MSTTDRMYDSDKKFWKLEISWLWRKITGQRKYSIWMKPPLRFHCPTVPYCIPDSPPLAFMLNQMNPVHILSPYYFKIHFNNILFCGLIFQARHSLQVYGTEILRGFMIPAMPPFPSHPALLNRIKLRDWKREGYVTSCGAWHEVTKLPGNRSDGSKDTGKSIRVWWY